MTKVLKDKNGNIITTLPIYCATNEQVQNSVDKRIADGTIKMPEVSEGTGDSILTLASTINCANNYITQKISEIAINVETDKQANGDKSGYTRYTLSNVKKGTTLRVLVGWNADNAIFFYDGTNSLNDSSTLKNYDNTIYYRELTLTQDYDVFYVATHTEKTTANPNYCTIKHIPTKYQNYPQYGGSFVPTVGNIVNDVETLSNAELVQYLGYDLTGAKAKANLQGGVWIGFGDSYTVYADTYFKEIATKYGMIYDGQGKVSSTVCGDGGGNKGFAPFWQRMDTFISKYTGSGQTIDSQTYSANDVKLITFMGGANDGFGKDSWLGSETSMDTNYVYGALNYIFNKLRSTFPNAQIITILQPANYYDTMNYTTDETAQTLGFKNLAELQTWDIYSFGQYKMEVKQRAVKKVSERFGVPIVDCIFDWYTVTNPTHRTKYWNADKLHLTSEGSMDLANKLDKKIAEVFGKM